MYFIFIDCFVYCWKLLCVLPAVSHQVAMRCFNQDVVNMEQNVHEVLSSHWTSICKRPLVLFTNTKTNTPTLQVWYIFWIKMKLFVPLSCRSHAEWAVRSEFPRCVETSTCCGSDRLWRWPGARRKTARFHLWLRSTPRISTARRTPWSKNEHIQSHLDRKINQKWWNLSTPTMEPVNCSGSSQ